MSESDAKAPNNYEKVMIAAREARRLNERHVISRIEPKEKATTEAIRRAEHGEVEYEYEPFRSQMEENVAEHSSNDEER